LTKPLKCSLSLSAKSRGVLPETVLGRPARLRANLSDREKAGTATYEADCLNGDMRIFSIRCADTRRRHATLAVMKHEAEDWRPYDVRRYANRPATCELEQLGVTVAKLYTERAKAEDTEIQHEIDSALADLAKWCESMAIPTSQQCG